MAELKNWRIHYNYGEFIAHGLAYGRASYKWSEGAGVHTSPISSVEIDESGLHIQTRNTLYFLDKDFTPKALELAADIRSEEYYINMMTAWFFATALAKQYEAALPYIEDRRLDAWTHNKAIQKSIESRRITDGQKAYLRSLKLK